MEFLKQPRFWVSIVIIAGAVVLAALGKMNGEAFSALIVGILVRFGSDKTTSSVTKALIPLALVGALLSGCCSTSACYLDRTRVAVEAADKIALDMIGQKCLSEATECGPVGQDKCPDWKACDSARAKYKAAMDAVQSELAVVNRLLADLGVK